MKKLGLIGGIGPESTLLYYRKLVYEAQRRVGADFFPNLTIESLNVFDVLTLCRNQNYTALVDYLMDGINNLTAAGVDVVALTGNTPHIVFDELQKRATVPLVSIIESTRDDALRLGVTKAGLLGTRFTMEEDFFKKPFRESGITVITPDTATMALIDEKITTELEQGVIKPETRADFVNIVQRMKKEKGIDAVILGCTELPLLFSDVLLPVVGLDTMQSHIDRLLAIILTED
ncbi:aspartate racemase [Pectobacterium brasiliense]|uniref:aspartate/glutamate racemase family protein n=1 Tax=Pectobacterium TaxID=122277 RepID=UPI0001A450B1|nr:MULTISPECIES: amino acid racemase [Pectobacterium]KGA23841.1 aspartate racemase [Pectobacterium brasiliense]KRF66257.1 aspartate racemase [Pectobacterium brasiliense]MBN3185297.1 amino acid racemase [Pectobacterium brasiliense]MBN3189129.1 amino acid racemase [Pectobacterium brasiliense]MCL6330432.1 amino acid racemase [Pectobacterium carotovorum subsp. carotovorum]